VKPAVYQNYERVRKGRRGVALAEVVDGRCTACHIVLRLQYYQDIKRGESILPCESCQRILYYNPPESFDDATQNVGGNASA
jgi:predicted  nucleic acid-binding Zn-ribbon protein